MPRSGKHGVVSIDGNVQEAVSNWVLVDTNTPDDQVHSASLGGHNRLAGVNDWNATFEGFGGFPIVFPGEKVEVKFFAGPTTGVYGTAGFAHTGEAIVDQLTISWDWKAGGSLKWSAQVSANGCLGSANVDIIDIPQICPVGMCGLHIDTRNHCAAGAWAPLDNVETATLTITSDNQPYSNSSTECCTYREAGNLDWSFEFTDQDDLYQMAKGVPYGLRFYVSPTAFWEIYWGLFFGITNHNVNIQTGEIKSKANMVNMSGHVCCENEGIETGHIINPASVTKWPILAA